MKHYVRSLIDLLAPIVCVDKLVLDLTRGMRPH